MTKQFTLKRMVAGTVLVATSVVSVGLGGSGTAGAATTDGASAYCHGDSALTVWAQRGRSTSNIVVNLPTWLATGRTFVRYSVVPDVGSGFTTGYYWADNVGLPGLFGHALNSGSKYWTKPDGSMLRYLSEVIGTAAPGTRHRIWQQRWVLQNGRWLGGTWEQVNYIGC